MFQSILNLLGFGKKEDFAELIKNGAEIIDVRTKGEYAGGHINGSKNIPLDQLSSNLSKINKEKTIITCCASGMRSASAKAILKSKGYENVYNGGGWASLNQKIK